MATRKPRQVKVSEIVLLFLISFFLIVYDWSGNSEYQRLEEYGIRTSAVIQDYNARNYSSTTTIEFKLLDGSTQRAQMSYAGVVGQRIEIFYDPAEPYKVVKVGAISHNLLYLAAFFFLFGCFGVYLRRGKIPF